MKYFQKVTGQSVYEKITDSFYMMFVRDDKVNNYVLFWR